MKSKESWSFQGSPKEETRQEERCTKLLKFERSQALRPTNADQRQLSTNQQAATSSQWLTDHPPVAGDPLST